MARILAISSQVARGSVGLSVIVPALQAQGHEVIALPTVVLSNHPGHAHVAGSRIDPAVLYKMLEALKANGWLSGVDAVLTGYLPTDMHVEFAAWAQLRASEARGRPVTYLCDPVLGDDPKGLYIDQRAADAIRTSLVPLADYVTPNRFELSFLSGSDVRSTRDCLDTHINSRATIVATSIPSGRRGETLNMLRSKEQSALTRVPLRPDAPHGTGDLFSALILSCLLDNDDPIAALAFATAGVDATLAASAGHDQLLIAALPSRAKAARHWPLEAIERAS